MMRVFGSFVIAVAVCALLLGAAPSQAKGPRPQQTKPQPTSQVDKPNLFDNTPARAHGSFPKPTKPGQKMAGWCSIDCGGYGTTVWAENVGDCACQCSSYCGSGCFAWEVYGSGTAYCSAF